MLQDSCSLARNVLYEKLIASLLLIPDSDGYNIVPQFAFLTSSLLYAELDFSITTREISHYLLKPEVINS